MGSDYIKLDPLYEDIRSRMEVFWIPLFLVQATHLVSSQPQSLKKELPDNSSTELQPCGTSPRCETMFQSSTELSLRGFCGVQFFDNGNCSRVDSAGNALCKVDAGCICCAECLEKDCSSKGEGWSCYSEEAASSFPQGSCLFDGSCRGTPGFPFSTRERFPLFRVTLLVRAGGPDFRHFAIAAGERVS